LAKRLSSFLGKTIGAFEGGDSFGLREIANHAIEEAALSNDRQLAEIALIAYCLHKMHSKQHVVRHARWRRIRKGILLDLKKAERGLGGGRPGEFEKSIASAIRSVRSSDEMMGNYAQNLFEKARVKYASTAYSLGLGLGQAAELTGADKKELLRYIGVTKIADRDVELVGIAERLRKLKRAIAGGRQ